MQKQKDIVLRKKLFFISFSIYIFSISLSVFFNRHLYADGAFFLADLINKKDSLYPLSNDNSVLRIGVNIINQSFATLCGRFNLLDFKVISIFFGIPLFFFGIFAEIICVRINRSNNCAPLLLFPIAAYVFWAMPSEIFIINPAFNAFWLVFILFFQIIDKGEYTRWKYVGLVLNLCFLVVSHEGIVIVGPLLLIILLVEECWFHNKTNLLPKRIAATGLIVGIAINLIYLQRKSAITREAYFNDLFKVINVHTLLKSNLLISLVGLMLVVIFGMKMLSRFYSAVFMCWGVGYIVYIQWICKQYSPVTEYCFRSLITIGLSGGILLAYIYYRLPHRIASKIAMESWYTITAIMLILQSLWQIGNTLAWSNYIESFRDRLQQNSGFLEAPLEVNEFDWSWTQPSLSLLLSNDYRVNSMILPTDQQLYPHLSGDSLWIPFMEVNPHIFTLEGLLQDRKGLPFSQSECQAIDISFENSSLPITMQGDNETSQFTIWIRNRSDSTLKCTGQNQVFLSYHIYKDNQLIEWEGLRSSLNADIGPGQSLKTNLEISSEQFPQSGDYFINIDLVIDGRFWFAENGTNTGMIPVHVEAGQP